MCQLATLLYDKAKNRKIRPIDTTLLNISAKEDKNYVF